MSVRRKGPNRWEARYRDPNGRQRGKTFGSAAEARRFLERVGADKQKGAWIDPRLGKVTVKTWATWWKEDRQDLRPRTAELYQGLLDRHILPTLGPVELARLSPAVVRSWHSRLLSEGTGASTVAKAYRLLSAMMTTAVADEVIVKNPCVVKGAGVEHAPERPVASVAEVTALAGAMPERLRLLVELAAWCGLRRGELLGLQRRDLDLLRNTLRVERAAVFLDGGTRIVGDPKTQAGSRTAAIPPHVVPKVKAHLEARVAPASDALVFTGVKGGPLRPQVLQEAWRTAREAVGVPYHLHDLRHAGNTWAAATGASTAELMSRMGHASSAAAIRYQHATADRDQAIAAALSGLANVAPVVPLRAVDEPQ